MNMYHRIPENKYLLIKLNLCSTQYYFTGFTQVWSMGAAKAERLIFDGNTLYICIYTAICSSSI